MLVGMLVWFSSRVARRTPVGLLQRHVRAIMKCCGWKVEAVGGWSLDQRLTSVAQ